MRSALVRYGLVMALAGMLPVSALFAEEAVKTLPTLLIKGEVVSLNADDPAATLLTVKDRYGFETPIFITENTAITKGEVTSQLADVTSGAEVSVEYNFDVNTAKRHAVSVALPAPPAPVEAAPAPDAVTDEPAAAAGVEAIESAESTEATEITEEATAEAAVAVEAAPAADVPADEEEAASDAP